MGRLKFCIPLLIVLLLSYSSVYSATFNVGDEASLINAINAANTNDQDDVITLTANITITAFDNTVNGANGLPVILGDSGHSLVIDGAGFELNVVTGTCNATPVADDFRVMMIDSGATVYLENITINSGCANRGGANPNGDDGSAIFNNGTLIINNSVISPFRGLDLGGSIYTNGNLIVLNSDLDSISEFRGGVIYNDDRATIINTRIRGQAYNRGGGVYNNGTLEIINSRISGSTASPTTTTVPFDGGGAIYNAGILNVQTTEFLNTSAAVEGGSAIKNTGTLTVDTSEFPGGSTDGGALFNSGTATITNSTFFATALNIMGQGGAIYSDGNTTLNNVTITENGNFTGEGGGIYLNSGTLTVRNSIISANDDASALDCVTNAGTFNTNANNIIGEFNNNGGCPVGANDTVPPAGERAGLNFLADNGGPTSTVSLTASSIAINASGAGATAFDQRGVPAIGTRDAGAFEDGASPTYPTVSFTNGASTFDENAGTVTIPLTVSGASNFGGTAQIFILNTRQGTANSRDDYAPSTVQTFNLDCSGGCPTSLNLSVTINTDAITEVDETILFEIVADNGFATISGISQHELTIQDREAVIVPTSEPVSSDNQPAIGVFDPAISKLGFLVPDQTGVTGETLEWVVTVSNTSAVDGINVTVTDTLIDALQINRVDAPNATVTINGQTVNVIYDVLPIGASRQFSIFTTVLQGASINNTACVSADNSVSEVCTTSSFVNQLPETGEAPINRSIVIIIILVLCGGIMLNLYTSTNAIK